MRYGNSSLRMRLRRRSSIGSMPRWRATQSIVRSSAKLVGAWPKPRTASSGVLWVSTAIGSYSIAAMRYGPQIAVTGLPS